MKHILTTLLIMSSVFAFSGGFRWPNIDYSYAKLYLFNIELEKPSWHDWDIYEDGIYATSKIGSGIDLSQATLEKLSRVLAHGAEELRLGLSKCYMPRHGIIYYDNLGNPVASFSLCLECDKISFWSKKSIPPIDDNARDFKKAEKQIAEIELIFRTANIPIYLNDQEYLTYLKSDSAFEDSGELFINDSSIDTSFFSHYSINQVMNWLGGSNLRENTETKITAGGDKWTYKVLRSSRGNELIFSFDETNPFLVEANIVHGALVLPNGVSVGMSVDDVQGSFMVYDGPAWPEHIEVKGEKVTINYYFKHHTLSKINLSFSIQ
jgi:hypothetical protein